MKTWTTQAEKRLNGYLEERAARERLVGEDAVELKEDLRRHIFEEAERRGDEVVSLIVLETILGQMDAGYRWVNEGSYSTPRRTSLWIWIFGVILPMVVLVVEAVTSVCGSVFFDPIPTWIHFILVASVPGLNWWLLKGAPRGNEKGKGVAAGVSLVIAVFYGLLFLPLTPISLIAVLYLGFGLLSLTPVLAGVMSWRIGRRVGKESDSPGQFRQGRWIGAAAALAILCGLEGPALWTRANVSIATADELAAEPAISRLRFFHSERVLLSACYEGGRGGMGTDISGWIAVGGTIIGFDEFRGGGQDRARDVFFRVTGKPFNSLKPPKSGGGSLVGRPNRLESFEFDDSLGGDEVAVRLKSLDMKESRFDGHVDSVSRIGYGEWTMVFQNRSRNAQEARCQVKLPRDGRVSRLTLWVNGEPREAAFSSVSKVKAAYKQVAVVQRQDPVLVTMVGPDTVMVQCFPVPPNGEMKIRFGVTAPLDGRRWELPRILERNFGTNDHLEHSVWLQADKGFELIGGKFPKVAVQDGPGKSLAVSLPALSAMSQGVTLVTEPLLDEPAVVWCEDPFAKLDERILIREPRMLRTEGSGKVVLVIDGSASMAEAKGRLVKALDFNVIAVLADDEARRVDAKSLNGYRFSGGRDNQTALREGIRISKENNGLPIVWVHGPQSVALSQGEALLQLLERGTVLPVIYDVEAVPGPNRLAEKIYRSGALKRGPRLDENFDQFLTALKNGGEERGWTWRRAADSTDLEGVKVWDHLARLWAIGAAEDPRQMIAEELRPELAARYQLVTPISGAVVLETQEQYTQNGLTPVDAAAAPKMPSVPEPSTGILVVLAATAAMMRRKREISPDRD